MSGAEEPTLASLGALAAESSETTPTFEVVDTLSDDDESTLKELALRAFNATGADGWGRVDIMRSNTGEWQLLEVNTVPGMTETSLVPKAAKEFGLSFSDLVTRILLLSVKE